MICNGKVKPEHQLRLSEHENAHIQKIKKSLSTKNFKTTIPVLWNRVLRSAKYSSTILCMMHGGEEIRVVPNGNRKKQFDLVLSSCKGNLPLEQQQYLDTNSPTQNQDHTLLLPMEPVLSPSKLHYHAKLVQ